MFRAGFEVVERGVDATGEDFGTGLTREALNPVVRTITNEGVKVVVGHTTIRTIRIGASKSACDDRFLTSAMAFAFAIRANVGF